MRTDRRLKNLEQVAGARLVGCSNCRERKLPDVVVVHDDELTPDFTCPHCGHNPDKPIIIRWVYEDVKEAGHD